MSFETDQDCSEKWILCLTTNQMARNTVFFPPKALFTSILDAISVFKNLEQGWLKDTSAPPTHRCPTICWFLAKLMSS